MRWLTKLSHKYSENGLDRQERVDLLAKKLKSAVDRAYGGQEKLTKKKAEVEAKAKADAEAEAEARAARKEQAKAARKAQKSTETNESVKGEQTVTEGDNGTKNGTKMSVAGELSETADLSALDKAKAMLEDDPNADTVSETGWWLGKDNKWRYEIADNDMRFERDGLYRNPQTLEDYIEHDKLFEAYPHLKNIRVKFERVVDGDLNTRGQYDAVNNVITLKSGRSNEDIKRTLIHEIQHAVQEYEGFSNGFNTNGGYIEWFNRVFDNVKETREYKSLKTPEERKAYVEEMAMIPGKRAIDKTAKSLYRNNYGEIEARAAAERLDMSDEQRRESPIANDGNTYSLEDIRSKFVDNLRSMGYTDTQIQEKMNGEKTNGRTEEIGSGNRGRNTKGKYIATDIEGTRSSRNLDTRGEGENTQNLHGGRVKYSVAEEVTDGSDSQSFAEMIAETRANKESNAALVEKFLNERGKHIDGSSVRKFLNGIIGAYGSEAWYGNVEKKYREMFEKVYNNKGGKVDADTVTEMFREVATLIFDGTTENEIETLVKDIRATEIKVSDSVKAEFGKDWNDFRMKNFGNLSLRNEKGESINEVYKKLSENHPELFSNEVTDEVEQLKIIADVTSKIRAEIKTRAYNEAQENIIERITTDLIEGTMSLDPQILYSYNANNKSKDYYKRRIADLKKAHEAWTDEVMEKIAAKNERQRIAYDKKMSYKRLKELGKALFTPTKKKHIPENMKNDLAALFRKIKFSEGTVADIAMGEYFDSYLNQTESGKESKFESFPPAIADLLQKIQTFDLANMTSAEMHEFSQLLRAVNQAVNQEDKLYHNSALASEVALGAIRNIKVAKKNWSAIAKKIGAADTLLGLSVWDAEGLFNYIGIPELTEAFLRIAEGQNVYANGIQKYSDLLASELVQTHGKKVDSEVNKESKNPVHKCERDFWSC